VALAWLAARLAAVLTTAPDSDLVRYADLATGLLGGSSARALELEYPPGALVPMLLARLLAADLQGFTRLFAFEMALLDLVTLLGVARLAHLLSHGHGAARARTALWAALVYAASSGLLGGLLVHRLDLAAAAPLVWAVVAWVGPERGRGRAEPLLALAVFVKLFALALLPLFLFEAARGRGCRGALRRGAAFAGASLALGLPAHLALGGEALAFLSVHAERGLQLESSGGSLLLLLAPLLEVPVLVTEHHRASHLEHPWAGALVAFAALAMPLSAALVLLVTARHAAKATAGDERALRRLLAAGAAAGVAALLVTSPVLSPQYLLWLLPLAAPVLAADEAQGGRGLVLLLGLCALTRLIFPGHYEELRALELLPTLALAARNALLVVLLAHLLGARLPTPAMPPGLERGLLASGGLAFVYWVLAYNLTAEGDADLFLHLKVGATVLAEGKVPTVDAWSATAAGRPFVAHEWLSGVLFESIRLTTGGAGLTALKVLAGLLIAAAAFHSLGRRRPRALLWPLLLPALLLVFSRLMVRPHLFSLVFVALLVAALEHFRHKRRLGVLLAFVPLQVLWANLHGGHVLGPLLLVFTGAALAGQALRQRGDARDVPPHARRDAAGLLALGAACLLAGLCNPYGAGIYRFALELFFESNVLREHVNEWMPSLSFVHRRGLWYWLNLAWLTSLVLGLALRPGRKDLVDLVLGALVVWLALGAARFIPYAALVGLPVQLRSWGPLMERALGPRSPRPRAGLELAVLGCLLAFTIRYGPFHGHLRAPMGVGIELPAYAPLVEELKARGGRTVVFAEYEVGAYLLWRGLPELVPVIDARIDVYGDTLAREYLEARGDPAKLLPYLERHEVELVLLRNPGPATQELGAALLAEGRWLVEEAPPGWVLLGRLPLP
jgi:hypothetical protein